MRDGDPDGSQMQGFQQPGNRRAVRAGLFGSLGPRHRHYFLTVHVPLDAMLQATLHDTIAERARIRSFERFYLANGVVQ